MLAEIRFIYLIVIEGVCSLEEESTSDRCKNVRTIYGKVNEDTFHIIL